MNNGRPAMLGMFSFLAESKVPSSVPPLTGLVPDLARNFVIHAPEGPSFAPETEPSEYPRTMVEG